MSIILNISTLIIVLIFSVKTFALESSDSLNTQILKIYKRQSVQGFSFLLVSLIGFGNLIELFISYLLNYPIQTRLIAARGIIFYVIFCYQFWIYREESRKI